MKTVVLLALVSLASPDGPPPSGWSLTARRPPAQRPAPPAKVRQQGPKYHRGHNCPRCGALQTRVARFLPGGGHMHVCPRCKTSWRH